MELFFVFFALLFPLAFFALFIVGIVLWILMLVHVAQHEHKDQVLWILIIVLGGWVGAIVYYFVVYRPMQQKTPRKKH